MPVCIFKFYLLFSFSIISLNAHSQALPFLGQWEVEEVKMGDQKMTPVAKWTIINKDGTFQSGNGWLQSSRGIWQYDHEKQVLLMHDSLDIKDDFGGFQVSFSNDQMKWQREEEGQMVEVLLEPMTELPLAPADYLEGVWELVEENSASVKEVEKHRFFFRWDRIYLHFSPSKEKISGYWHIHGHKPEITLLPHSQGKNPESWSITVNSEELIMAGVSDSNREMIRVYMRKNAL